MKASDKQTILDLEFNVIIEWLAQYAVEKKTLKRITELVPSNDFKQIFLDLEKENEFR